ncbi:MAG: hypothetical protein BMS9Abin23_0200 [Thermodesulfobacteriota bacterium]|nr:MAG: hypothetical protein BMS9Abin23_0200 [Thermodesulfobacteriota bacterium]
MSHNKREPGNAYATALRFLSYRERSVKEVRDRLIDKGFGDEETDRVVAGLIETGLVNDERFASMLASTRLRNKNWGPAKIAAELRVKGVSREIAGKVLSQFDGEDESNAAQRAFSKWARKSGATLTGPDRKDLDRAIRHLKARGFSTPLILKVVGGLKHGQDSDNP